MFTTLYAGQCFNNKGTNLSTEIQLEHKKKKLIIGFWAARKQNPPQKI